FSDEYVATLATNMGGSVLYGTGGASKFLYSRRDNRVIKQANDFHAWVRNTYDKRPKKAHAQFINEVLDGLISSDQKRFQAEERRAKGYDTIIAWTIVAVDALALTTGLAEPYPGS
ncbi:hypothetical protein, partial [Mycobacterium sp. 050134]|uniref:hypothetical protein n=1 Tax=Mycobacterium sp. 050134 TaxID=3096111 RepID=UPI002EDACD8A